MQRQNKETTPLLIRELRQDHIAIDIYPTSSKIVDRWQDEYDLLKAITEIVYDQRREIIIDSRVKQIVLGLAAAINMLVGFKFYSNGFLCVNENTGDFDNTCGYVQWLLGIICLSLGMLYLLLCANTKLYGEIKSVETRFIDETKIADLRICNDIIDVSRHYQLDITRTTPTKEVLPELKQQAKKILLQLETVKTADRLLKKQRLPQELRSFILNKAGLFKPTDLFESVNITRFRNLK